MSESVQPKTFSLQDFIRANMVPPGQQVCLCEHVDSQYIKTDWRGPFREIPDPYAHRTVEQVFVPCSTVASDRYSFTLYFILALES